MITKTYRTSLDLSQTVFSSCNPSDLLFFDIETTGFTAQSSSLYLIGAVSYKEPDWIVTQWFAKFPEQESAVLDAFLSFASGFTHIIHFNGNRFDLPYLADKCRAYRRQNTLTRLVSHDLYQMIRPLKPLLNLSSLKQKSLEEYLGLYREDPFSGGELIEVYLSYIAYPSPETLQVLLLHNYEDMLGMLSILPLLSYLTVTDARCSAQNCSICGDTLILHARLLYPLPKPFFWQNDYFSLSGEQASLTLSVNVAQKTLKHFFEDYKNYYYLPMEDTAIHKSVASFVDKEFRQPAKASTCYQKKAGCFLPQFLPLFEPVFKETYRDRISYFALTEDFLQDTDAQQRYLRHLLEQVSKNQT